MPENESAAAKATPPLETSGPPSWLDASFVTTALSKQFAVTTLHVENAVAAGENYATVVYRALADTTLGPISLIVKCIPESEFRAKFILEGGIMEREIGMYKKTLPLLRGSLSKPNYPPCYHSLMEGARGALVLRDLRPLGYRTSDRQLGLDVAHCRLALTELAHLHGLSAALRVQQPEVFKAEIQDKYVDVMYAEKNRNNTNMFLKASLDALAEAVETSFSFRFKEIGKLILTFSETAFDDIQKLVNVPEKDIADKVLVLNHGDFWSNNMLFKYAEGSKEPLACSMVDFQISRCASPVLDLLYFFYTSTTQATRRAHMDELLQLYLHEAHQAMSERGVVDAGNKFYKSVEEIKLDMKANLDFGFLFSCIVMPIVIADKSAVPDLDEMTDDTFMIKDESPFIKMYAGKLFRERFTELLEDFDDLGYFMERSNRKTHT